MNISRRTLFLLAAAVFLAGLQPGCGPAQRPRQLDDISKGRIEPGQTIGSLAEVFAFEPILVQGYGVVAGLAGTGSAQCPSKVREYLKNYISRQARGLNADEFINGEDTAVVNVYGLIPAGAARGQHFDVKVSAISGTQTTSLAGGRLYTTELFARGGMVKSQLLARSQGPIFIDKIEDEKPDERIGYVLDGGIVQDDYKIALVLFEPDFVVSNIIRNRINERFGAEVAKAVKSGLIYLSPPKQYNGQEIKFIALVRAVSVLKDPDNKKTISDLIRRLATGDDKEAAEMKLEVIGQPALKKLAALLNSSNEQVRLRAGRCMLNIGDDKAVATLKQIAVQGEKPNRIDAIKAIANSAKRKRAIGIIAAAINSATDFEVMLAAYEALQKLDDISITRRVVAGSFYIDEVRYDLPKSIFVARNGTPKVVVFGAPLKCREDFFIDFEDGSIILDARSGNKYVSILRKHPRRPNIMSLKSSHDLADVIRVLCGQPVGSEKTVAKQSGLAVTYSDLAAILRKMCQRGAVDAQFYTEELPKTQ